MFDERYIFAILSCICFISIVPFLQNYTFPLNVFYAFLGVACGFIALGIMIEITKDKMRKFYTKREWHHVKCFEKLKKEKTNKSKTIIYQCKACKWKGLFSELFSKPYDDEYFAYCPICKEPETEEMMK